MDAIVHDHRANRLLAALAPKTFDLVRPELRSISLNAGRTLYEPGGAIDQIYFPHGGLVSLLYGLVLFGAPLAGAVVLTWWIGVYAIVSGISLPLEASTSVT